MRPFAVFDGKGSSGYYTLNLMADKAIEKARLQASRCVNDNHNDAGSLDGMYTKRMKRVWLAWRRIILSPWPVWRNGQRSQLPTFDTMVPSQNQPPIWASLMFAEWYDAHARQS